MLVSTIRCMYSHLFLLRCGTSSVGRASACQAEGRRFETGVPHHYIFIYFSLYSSYAI